VTNPSSQDLLDRLLLLHPKLIDLSLGRMERLLSALGNPEKQCPPIIHIAGTNGKGSTLAYIRAMLEADGKRVCAYTSPHLVDFHERIYLAGAPITEQALAGYLNDCETANDGHPITFFEITTAAAFLAFRDCPADYLLLEVGLGGRLDATNVTDSLISVITPISIDHQEFLGSDLADIAGEKAGIIKAKQTVICAPQPPKVLERIEAQATRMQSQLSLGDRDWFANRENGRLLFETHILEAYTDPSTASSSNTYTGLRDYALPNLVGQHQITNAGTALAVADYLSISETAREQGLGRANWPARLQALTQGKWVRELRKQLPKAEIWLDGGHNEAAAGAISDWAQERQTAVPAPLHVICGMLKTKANGAFMQQIAQLKRTCSVTLHAISIPNQANSLTATELAQSATDKDLSAKAYDSLDQAIASIKDHDARILICGSLYLAGDVLRRNAN